MSILKNKTKREEILSKQKLEKEKLVKAISEVAATEGGERLFRHLARICGFHKSNVVVNSETQEISPISTVYNEARRDIYLGLRKHINKNDLINIELKEQ